MRAVTRLPSTTASSSTHSAPALRRSVLSDGQEAILRPRAAPASITLQGPWQIAATQEIRQWEQGHDSHLPIIAMTAHTMQGDRESCVEAGMDGYIAKPLERGELQRTIEEIMKTGEAVSGKSHD